jgi:hypothetical protein
MHSPRTSRDGMGIGWTAGVFACVFVLQGCASWHSAAEPIRPGGEPAVPAARVAAPAPQPIGEETIARYGGDVQRDMHARTVEPVISLMPVAPAARPTAPVPNRFAYPFYPPPPPPGAQAYPPYSEAVERAVIGGIVGGIIGAQLRGGSGRAGDAGLGAAMGALVGLGTSGNPCAAPNGGGIAGAVLGGILGNQVGSGNGRNAATAIGATLGAIAGTRAGSPQPDCR